MNSTELDKFNNIGFKTNGTFSIKKARTIFDADFAILSIFFHNSYGKGTRLSTFEEFLNYKAQNPTRTNATKINEIEIIKGNLLNDGLPRFGLLIIPDYILGTDDIIKSKLEQKK